MRYYRFGIKFAGLLIAGGLPASAAASTLFITANVRVGPWVERDGFPPHGAEATAAYSSSDGLTINRSSFGAVSASDESGLGRYVLEASFNHPEDFWHTGGPSFEPFLEILPHNARASVSVDAAAGVIRVFGASESSEGWSGGSFRDTITLVNPNSVVTPIRMVVDVEDRTRGRPTLEWAGWIMFDDAVLLFVTEPSDISLYLWEGWAAAPEISWSDPYHARFIATYNLAPGAHKIGDLTMVMQTWQWPYVDEKVLSDYRATLRLDLANTGVTFSSASGLLLSSVPEPATSGLIGAALLTGMILLRRRRP
jgi:hypothetical protein